MRRGDLIDLVDRAHAPAPSPALTADQITASLGACERLIAWCESQRLQSTRLLDEVGVVPELALASATRCDNRQAEQVVSRAGTAQQAPQFAAALDAGEVAAAHLDQLGDVLRRVDDKARQRLLDDTDRLLRVASSSTPSEFGRMLRREARRLSSDDGMSRLRRQLGAVRLRTWVEPELGMHVWKLTVDPLTAMRLDAKVRALTEALFHSTHPEECPTDPLDRQSFLRAHALLNLLEGRSGANLARPEFVVVVDATGPAGPVIDCGLPVEVPWRVLADLAGEADVHTIVIRNGVVVHAPGALDLGRSTRLANRHQRRALRAMYARCAMPGCAVRFDDCTIHHIVWWRRGGLTDLDNLLPVCSRHHHLIHEGGWCISLGPQRVLTVRCPDGSVMTTGPPGRAGP